MNTATAKERAFKRRESTILGAAFSLFAEFGIESTTMDMIAEKAGVGKGTIYKHFTKKNDIYATLIIQQSRALVADFHHMDPHTPILTRIRKMIRITWENHTRDMQTYEVGRKCRQFIIVEDLPRHIREEYDQVHQAKKEFGKQLFQRAIDEEIFRKADVNNMVAATAGLYLGMLEMAMEEEIRPTEELYQILENMIFRGFMV
ncbi:MAG: TetR/AcrR family transcriptional regulator [Desulfobacterales bacterium]|nr:TetR/AcrR family transcriptional regulator [Desulfobacterales bacterium]